MEQNIVFFNYLTNLILSFKFSKIYMNVIIIYSPGFHNDSFRIVLFCNIRAQFKWKSLYIIFLKEQSNPEVYTLATHNSNTYRKYYVGHLQKVKFNLKIISSYKRMPDFDWLLARVLFEYPHFKRICQFFTTAGEYVSNTMVVAMVDIPFFFFFFIFASIFPTRIFGYDVTQKVS